MHTITTTSAPLPSTTPARPAATDARRSRGIVTVALALLLGLLGAVLAPAQSARADEGGTIFSLLNQSRNGQGLGSLERMAALDATALDWANRMAAAGTLSHNPSVASQIPGGWSRLGENVAQGYRTGASMHEGWWNSSGHRANMLGDFTHVGVAFLSAGGSTWGVQVFAKYGGSVAAPAPPPAPAPAAPAPAPAPAPPAPAPAPVAAAPAAPPAPAAAATPDPQPSVIDPRPLPSIDPSILPTPSAEPSSAVPTPRPSDPSASPSGGSPDDDLDETASSAPLWGWLALAGLLAVAALGLIPLARRRGRAR